MKKINFVSGMVDISLTSLGMIKNNKIRITYSIIFGILCSGGFCGAVVGFINTTGAGYKLESMASLLANLNSVVLFVTVNLSYARITQLFVQLKGPKEDFGDLINRTDKYIKKKLIWYFITLTSQGSLFSLVTMISSLFEEKNNDMFSIVVPFWFSCSNKRVNFKIPCVHWENFSKMQLFGANMVQVVFVMLQFAVYISSFALYGISIGELEMHLENIRVKVECFNMLNKSGFVFENKNSCNNSNPRLMQKEDKSIQKEENSIQKEKKSTQGLMEVIKYQQFLHGCILQAAYAWKPYLTCIYLTSFVDITMVLFTTFQEQENSTIFIMKTGSLVLFRFLLLLIISSYAQTLATLIDKIFEETTNMMWYEQSLKFRKIYITVLILNQRGIRMLAGGIIQINLNSFLKLLKTMYSILNILKLKYGK